MYLQEEVNSTSLSSATSIPPISLEQHHVLDPERDMFIFSLLFCVVHMRRPKSPWIEQNTILSLMSQWVGSEAANPEDNLSFIHCILHTPSSHLKLCSGLKISSSSVSQQRASHSAGRPERLLKPGCPKSAQLLESVARWLLQLLPGLLGRGQPTLLQASWASWEHGGGSEWPPICQLQALLENSVCSSPLPLPRLSFPEGPVHFLFSASPP